MADQLIQIGADGSVTALRPSKGGLDISRLGQARTVRSTDIVWSVEYQQWTVLLLREKDSRPWWERWLLRKPQAFLDAHRWFVAFSGVRDLILSVAHQCGIDPEAYRFGRDGLLLFDSYEDAVRAEVVYIQRMREVYGPDCL